MPVLRRTGCVLAAIGAAAAVFAGAAHATSTVFILQGGGWGHGVGLGQWGAEGAALHGWSYTQILGHYYPHTTLAHERARSLRILIAEKKAAVSVGSTKPFLLVDARGRKVHVRPRALRFGWKLALGKQRLVPPVEVKPGAAVLTFDGSGYRGTLTLRRQGRTLDVVNTLPLELYLRGVVPSEMPEHWQLAAYEAQAVAARSYALAELRGAGTFDLYGDSRDQEYGGIAAETPITDEAVSHTTGQVLTYDGRPILAYYSSSTGGRTEAVEDAFPGRAAIPYLVSVPDPFDSISPYHTWTLRLGLPFLDKKLGFRATDLVAQHDASGHVTDVELVGADGATKNVTGADFRTALGLRSSRFAVEALSLATPTGLAAYNRPFALQGYVRGVGGVSLQEELPNGSWRLAGNVHAAPNGRFTVYVRPQLGTSYRLAVDQIAGPSVAVGVVPQLSVRADGDSVTGTIRPSVPLSVERQVGGVWHVVAHVPVGPSGYFRAKVHTGRYRVSSSASRTLASATSPSVSVQPQHVR